jgi:hypothetical protein
MDTANDLDDVGAGWAFTMAIMDNLFGAVPKYRF